ncbi:16353_t:CDS:2 [Acaulospora morrowiae]|uniref:16353_t:CDS:1 n=1 Tax=Acaulospora morrowiae TaxID=94023 RepID=A0A9N9EZG9_9GLOM|nr:16353_t:CDS:2 [Acaulospora morrowiae]
MSGDEIEVQSNHSEVIPLECIRICDVTTPRDGHASSGTEELVINTELVIDIHLRSLITEIKNELNRGMMTNLDLKNHIQKYLESKQQSLERVFIYLSERAHQEPSFSASNQGNKDASTRLNALQRRSKLHTLISKLIKTQKSNHECINVS